MLFTERKLSGQQQLVDQYTAKQSNDSKHPRRKQPALKGVAVTS